ncbi:MAG: biotin--[acetyl-CoA-carboxylase] ligase [Elusimicrobiaceae bacterium]|nr:biotin--[acetyl-CoA-carboxylase] ligase [Elusimicrobiaceae bacterium]
MRKMLRFDELDSTNAYAKRNCSLIENQTIIVAKTQSAGRGRLSRSWLSEPGGLYFSVVLKPTQITHLANLTQLMALSVCQVLRELGVAAQLKWPNDVLVNDKKICGILSEAVTSENKFDALVLGVGVNIAQTDLSRAGQPAVSLAMLGINYDAEKMLQQILDRFFAQYENVLQNGFSAIRTDYLNYFPYIGKEVIIAHGTTPTRGTVQTISPVGELILNTPAGQTVISIGDMCI